MAIIRNTALVSVVRGRLGDTIFKVCDGKQIACDMPLSVANPNTLRQQLARAAMTDFSKGWIDDLTQAQRDNWETIATESQGNWNMPNGWRALWNISKDKRTGKDAYVKTGMYSRFAGMADIADAPLKYAQPPALAGYAAAYDSGTGFCTISWTNSADYPANAMVLTKVQSQQKHFHRQLLEYVAVAADQQEFEQVNGPLGVALLLADIQSSFIYLQSCVFTAKGRLSPPSQTLCIELTP